MSSRVLFSALALTLSTLTFGQEPPVRLYAAGSLRTAMTEIAQAFMAAGGPPVVATFGSSGLLRERIEGGEPADVFASADMGNPEALARAGRASAPVLFARNRLCALLSPGIAATPDTLLQLMLDPQIRIGTSTPKADPSGDYTWQLFEKAEKQRPGAYATLDAKALKLTGGPNSPAPPGNRSLYGLMITEHKAEIFLTYCTNAILAVREVQDARMVTLPETLAVGADYGLTTMNNAAPGAARFATFVLSEKAKSILVRHGFTVGTQ